MPKEMSDMDKEKEKRLKKFLGESTTLIDIDDTFDFKCQQCGMCCMNRKDIIVNPWDVFQIAKHEKISPNIVLKKYMICSLGSESKIPMVILNCDQEPNHWCPFLELDIKNGCKFKCRIHECSPGACQNHPIGTLFQYKQEKGVDWDEPMIQFCKVESCDNSKGHNNHVKVRDWTKRYMDNLENIDLAHKIQSLCNEYFMADDLMLIVSYLKRYADADLEKSPNLLKEKTIKKVSEMLDKVIGAFTNGTIQYGYAEYDISQDFAEQAKKNIESLRELYEYTKSMMDAFKRTIGMPDDVEDVKKWILTDAMSHGLIDETELSKEVINFIKKKACNQ